MNNTMSRSVLAGLVLIGLSGAAGAASVGRSDRQAMGDALFTGPLAASNPTALPVGHFDVEPYLLDSIQYGSYNKNWNESSTTTSHAYRSVTLLEYGLTPRLSVSLLPQFGYNDSNGGQSSNGPQLGDITVRAHYMLTQFEEGGWLPTTAIAVAQSLPTGRYDGLGANPANGLGSGIASTTVGFWVQDYFWMPTGRILRARLNLSYAFADENASVHGVSVYGTGPGFSGKVDTGDTFTADVAFEYSLTQHWVPVFEALYSRTGSGTVAGTSSVPNQTGGLITAPIRSNSGSSESIQVAPAIEYNWNGHYGVIVGAQATVAGRNTSATVTPQAAFNVYY